MDKIYESKYHQLEKNYWWFKARRDMIFRLLKKYHVDQHAKILDMGCSGGVMIQSLKRKGFKNIHGIDISERAINLCKEKGIKNVFVMDATLPKFADEEFDIIIASDILEHIENDDLTLFNWNRILKSTGKLIIFAPAFNFLWSEHDKINHHYRRYTKSTLTKVLKKTGFEIDKSSYWNIKLFSPTCLLRAIQFIFPITRKKSHVYGMHPILNNLLFYLLKSENWFIERIDFPIGISVFAIARKKCLI